LYQEKSGNPAFSILNEKTVKYIWNET
jgi:hypothetical protein